MKNLLIALILFSLGISLISCNGGELPTDTHTTGVVTESGMPSNSEDNNGPVELDLKWNFGYVASSSHSTMPNQLVENGDCYSYTDVFTVAKAGTTITFMDDNTNSNGETRFASSNVYVFSSWIEMDGEWQLERYGFNYEGDTSTESEIVALSKNGVVQYTYTTTVDNEHLRLCFRSGQSASFTPAVFPTVVSEYTGNRGTGRDKLSLKRWIEGTKLDYYNSALYGLTVNAIGDSYFAGTILPPEEVWLNLLGAKYNMDMNNYGISGNSISGVASNSMCERYTEMKDNDPQIILLEGGRNDYNKQAEIGTSGSSKKNTFIGALNVTIDGLQEKYPNAMIVLISPWNFPPTNSGPYTRQMYHEAMRSVAEEQGVYFLDASDPATIGVDMTSESFRTQYCLTPTDVSHLNFEGMKLVMPKFEKMIADFYTDFLSKQ